MARINNLGVIGKFAISLIAVVVVQGILAFRFRVFGYFDLPLIYTVYYGFTLGRPSVSILAGSGLGLMQDSLSGAPLGTNGFSKSLIGFLAASAGTKFNLDQPLTRAIALFLFTIGDGLIVSILGLMAGEPSTSIYSGNIWGWLLSATFNMLLGLMMLGYHDRAGNAAA